MTSKFFLTMHFIFFSEFSSHLISYLMSSKVMGYCLRHCFGTQQCTVKKIKNQNSISLARPFARSGQSSLSPVLERGGPPFVLANRRLGPTAIYMGNMWIPGVQSSPQVASTSACTSKETFCTAQQQADSLHSGSPGSPFGDNATALGGGRSYGHDSGDCPA
jgi:hypothetical protein